MASAQSLKVILKEFDSLNSSDFIRLYFHVQNHFDTMKQNNPITTSDIIYYVKNADKVKNRIKLSRQAKKKSPPSPA